MRLYLACSLILLLAMPVMLTSGCSDSSEENMTAEQLADRAHERAINAIRQAQGDADEADEDGDEDGEGNGEKNIAANNARKNTTSGQSSQAQQSFGQKSQQQNQQHEQFDREIRQSTQSQQPQQSQQSRMAAGNDNTRTQSTGNNNTSNNARNNTNNNAANARPAAQGNGKYSVFVEHKLTDPGMNNAHSHTVLIPEGWKVEGGLVRPNIKLYNMPVVIDFKVVAPDGRRAAILPRMSFEFDNQQPGQAGSPTMGGNLYMPLPESAGRWLLGMAQQNPDPSIKDLKLVDEKLEETLTQQLRKQAAPLYQSAQQLNQMSSTTGVGAIYDTQAQVITFTYTKDGQPFEETFLVAWYANLTTIRGQISSGLWGITFMVSVRDKPGKDPTKDPMIQTIFQSFRATAAWDNEMNKYWVEINRIRAKGQADRQRQNAKHNEFMRRNNAEISDIIAGGYKNRQAIQDRGQQNTVDAIHEVTPYSTPSGEVVRLPSYYEHAYTDGNGRYLLNNDANYNPNLDPTFNSQSWQTINQAR